MLNAQCSMLNTQYSIKNDKNSIFNTVLKKNTIMRLYKFKNYVGLVCFIEHFELCRTGLLTFLSFIFSNFIILVINCCL